MYYELMYSGDSWIAYDVYKQNACSPAAKWLCGHPSRSVCILMAEKLGYTWAGV